MKKILIFSSTGGGGHVSVASAIEQCLQQEYAVQIVYVFAQALGTIDPLRILTLGHIRCEDFYNFLLRKKWTGLLNALYQMGRFAFKFDPGLTTYLIKKNIKNNAPDLVISVVPLANESIKNACDALQIPFLLVPTDLNPYSFIHDLKNVAKSSMHCAISFNDPMILNLFARENFPADRCIVTDFPIKQSFFESKDSAALKHEFGVPADKKVIMVLMGAAGSDVTYKYCKTLAQLDFPVHLLICLGRNEKLREKIETLPLPHHISCTILGSTDRIADLMAIADLCITKAGTVSVCETIYMNLPMILDNTSIPLAWEKFNLEFVNRHQFGRVSNNFRHLNHLVKSIVMNPSYYAYLKTNLQMYPKVFFGSRFKKLIAKMIEHKTL